jgi:hypothetical protein
MYYHHATVALSGGNGAQILFGHGTINTHFHINQEDILNFF